MKKIKSINVDEDIYKEFLIYTITIKSSVSKELEKYMRFVLNKKRK